MLLTAAAVTGKMSIGKVAGISALSASLCDFIMGSATYHFWDKQKKNKSSVTFKRKKKKKRSWQD